MLALIRRVSHTTLHTLRLSVLLTPEDLPFTGLASLTVEISTAFANSTDYSASAFEGRLLPIQPYCNQIDMLMQKIFDGLPLDFFSNPPTSLAGLVL